MIDKNDYLVFGIVSDYVQDPYERTCLGMTCKDLKALFYERDCAFRYSGKVLTLVRFLRPSQLVDVCFRAYLRISTVADPDHFFFLVRLMDVNPVHIGACI